MFTKDYTVSVLLLTFKYGEEVCVLERKRGGEEREREMEGEREVNKWRRDRGKDVFPYLRNDF